jgi:hypothetical protein
MKVLPRYIIILLALLPILSAVSCNDDFDEFGEESLYDGGMFIYGSTDFTRAARTWWHSDDSIGISGNGYVNTQYRVDNSSNMESAKFKYYSGQEICYNSANRNRARYSAYYPFMGDTCISPGIVYHETYDQSDSAQRTYDYLYDDTVNIKENVFFHFHHMMASVYFLFVTPEAEPASDTLGFILDTTFICRGYFNTETGQAWATGTTRGTIHDTIMVDSGVYPTAQLILFPQDSLAADTNSMNFTVYTKDSVYHGNFWFPKLEAGNQYTFTVIVGTSVGVWAYLNPWMPGPHGYAFNPHGVIWPWTPGENGYPFDPDGKLWPWGKGQNGVDMPVVGKDSLHPWIGGPIGKQFKATDSVVINPWAGGAHAVTDTINGDTLVPWGHGDSTSSLSFPNKLNPWAAGPLAVTDTIQGDTLKPWAPGIHAVTDTINADTTLYPWAHGDSTWQNYLFDTSTITPWGGNTGANSFQDVTNAFIENWNGGEPMTDFDSVYYSILHPWIGGEQTDPPFWDKYFPWIGGADSRDMRVSSGSQVFPWGKAATVDSGRAIQRNGADSTYIFAWGSDPGRSVSPAIPHTTKPTTAKQRFMTYLKRRLYLYNK